MPSKSLPRLLRFILKSTSLTNHSISIGMYEWYVYYVQYIVYYILYIVSLTGASPPSRHTMMQSGSVSTGTKLNHIWGKLGLPSARTTGYFLLQ